MRKSSKFAVLLTATMVFTSVPAVSAFAETRHQYETSWRSGASPARRDVDRGRSRNDRDLLTGVVARIDLRRDLVVLRERRSGRPIVVELEGRRNRRGVDLRDLRRGDRVTFAGEWERGGRFEARRIERVDSRRGRR